MERSPTCDALGSVDHVIDDVPGFVEAVRLAARAAAKKRLVSIGVKPTRAETGTATSTAVRNCPRRRRVRGSALCRETERATAQDFVASGEYLGMPRSSVPAANLFGGARKARAGGSRERAKGLDKSRRDLDFLRLDREEFSRCPSISIDYAVMERTDRAAVVPADIGLERCRLVVGALGARGEGRR